jgi:hypothetical protein
MSPLVGNVASRPLKHVRNDPHEVAISRSWAGESKIVSPLREENYLEDK